jgi:ankyrin repeat protein
MLQELTRRNLLKAAPIGFMSARSLWSQDSTKASDASANNSSNPPKPVTEKVRGPREDLDTVWEFVRAGHNNLPRVKELLALDPMLIFSSWDWGKGDGGQWETALGGASHTGNREIAQYLLSAGARIDCFCAAMLGQRDVVLALLKADNSVAICKGPHGYTMLYHAAISGDLIIADALKALLPANAKDYNQALSAAARDGHLAMTKWLFENGATNPNSPDGFGKTPLSVALAKGYADVAEEFRRHGGTEGI